MSKYIDADKLIDIIVECKDEPFKKSSVYAILALMPSASVAEIIICKDCAFYDAKKNEGFCYMYQCAKHENGFCNVGLARKERKETK